jgi:2-polyprenyl-6-methoxyphenol hydroxylase-like FAD-dependent oxidoreductase
MKERKTQFPWLVGTDGAHSIIRKILALTFLGETRKADKMVVGDIQVFVGLDASQVREIIVISFHLNLVLCSFGIDGSDPQTYTV